MATRAELSERRAERWGKVVRDWERSGQTHGEFCRRHGVSIHSLRTWIYKFKKRGWKNLSRGSVLPAVKPNGPDGKEKHLEPSSASVFLPVRVAAEAKADTGLEVVLALGRRITVGRGFDPETLLRLVATLEGAGC